MFTEVILMLGNIQQKSATRSYRMQAVEKFCCLNTAVEIETLERPFIEGTLHIHL
jgi:hypothetical protein